MLGLKLNHVSNEAPGVCGRRLTTMTFCMMINGFCIVEPDVFLCLHVFPWTSVYVKIPILGWMNLISISHSFKLHYSMLSVIAFLSTVPVLIHVHIHWPKAKYGQEIINKTRGNEGRGNDEWTNRRNDIFYDNENNDNHIQYSYRPGFLLK